MDLLLGLFLILFTGMVILNMSLDSTKLRKYLNKGILVSAIALVLLFALPYYVQDNVDYKKHDDLNTLLV